jgi:hypothetical protein
MQESELREKNEKYKSYKMTSISQCLTQYTSAFVYTR